MAKFKSSFTAFQSMEEDAGCDEVKTQQSSNQTTDNHEEVQETGGEIAEESMQANQEDETKDCPSQHQSTSSITLKLNKLNCDSSSSDDPKPGPSNSAADFDLEVKYLSVLFSSII